MNQGNYQQIIIGAGFAGICAAIKLKQAGMNDFIILERNPHLGGTWWDNAYPGAACDVESHLYSYSFEPKPDWSRQFSPQEEILHYLENCASKYGLDKQIHFNCNVNQAVFDEQNGVWKVSTKASEVFTAPVLISCSGGLSQPALPDIAGISDFKGEKFHSARWDKKYDLKNKTVAVIGTGASAIQIVPAIAPEVKQLLLFQRTPPWILPKPDKPISSFRKWCYKNLPFTRNLYRGRLYWVHEIMAIGFTGNISLMKLVGKLAQRHIRTSISDNDLAQQVTPNYIMGCKRVLLSNDYYPAIQRANVELVTSPIEKLNETGILTKDGKQRNIDAVIFATGFNASEGMVVFDIKGKNNLDLNEAWRNGAEAYLGTTVSGFPNLFLVVGPNTGLGHSSMILMIEAQVNYIMGALHALKNEDAKFLDLKKSALQLYNDELQLKLAKSVWQKGGCHSWYQTKNGKNVTLWPGFTFTFMRRTRQFETDKYELVK
jgi:cation diffusion facilitator CzcD-associated flavoprotein CzcO